MIQRQMTAQELFGKSLQLIYAARRQINPVRRFFATRPTGSLRKAKRLRIGEGARRSGNHRKYRLFFDQKQGFLFLDLSFANRSDALWGTEALGFALSGCYHRLPLWHASTHLLMLENHKILSRSCQLLAATSKMRAILAEPPARSLPV